MVGKKVYELLYIKVVQWSNEDLLNASVDNHDKFFIEDETNWNSVVEG